VKDLRPADVGLGLDQCFEIWVGLAVSVLESWVPVVDFAIEGVK